MFGTGNAMATRCYNTCFAIENGEDFFLTDAGGGNGILSQIDAAEIPYRRIRHLFVTHGHTDHVLGVIWVIRKIGMLMTENAYDGDLSIYCHDEVAHIIDTMCTLLLPTRLLSLFGSRIVLCEVTDGQSGVIAGLDITFFDIGSAKTKQFGYHAVLPDGQTLVCLGDEPCGEGGKEHAEGCDWLLSEAFCLYSERDIFNPYDKNHSTALDAGRLAEALGAGNLVLYHTEDSNLAERKRRYTDEAETVFDGNVFVPDDLERIDLVG